MRLDLQAQVRLCAQREGERRSGRESASEGVEAGCSHGKEEQGRRASTVQRRRWALLRHAVGTHGGFLSWEVEAVFCFVFLTSAGWAGAWLVGWLRRVSEHTLPSLQPAHTALCFYSGQRSWDACVLVSTQCGTHAQVPSPCLPQACTPTLPYTHTLFRASWIEVRQVASDQVPPSLVLSLLICMREAGLEASKGSPLEPSVTNTGFRFSLPECQPHHQ